MIDHLIRSNLIKTPFNSCIMANFKHVNCRLFLADFSPQSVQSAVLASAQVCGHCEWLPVSTQWPLGLPADVTSIESCVSTNCQIHPCSATTEDCLPTARFRFRISSCVLSFQFSIYENLFTANGRQQSKKKSRTSLSYNTHTKQT